MEETSLRDLDPDTMWSFVWAPQSVYIKNRGGGWGIGDETNGVLSTLCSFGKDMKPIERTLRENCCDICQSLWRALRKAFIAFEGKDIKIDWNISPDACYIKVDGNWVKSIRVFSSKTSPCPWGIFPAPFADLPHNSSLAIGAPILDKVVALVERCCQHHDCQARDFTPNLPSRVIDIGKDDFTIRLVDGNQCQSRYLCLSYCWGGEQPLKTTSRNLADHLARIPWTTIPKLFQDFINLARKLCIRYVWIDSLCIVQDDRDDWAKESGRMCQIYENSFLTVSATIAENCNAGLWDSSISLVREMEGISTQGVHYSWLAMYGIPVLHPKPEFTSDREIWPLLRRGWAFQERTLAPRVLHFLPGEIMWECKEETFCECGGMTVSHYGSVNPKSKSFHQFLALGDNVKQAAIWREIVQHYSGLRWTKLSDKLPALSGVAQKLMQVSPNKRYLAGLWEDSLLEDLLWVNHRTFDYAYRYSVSGPGPTWSWTAVCDTVHFATGSGYNPAYDDPSAGDECVGKYINIIGAYCELATTDRTGEVRKGVLKVEGRLYKGLLRRSKGYPGDEIPKDILDCAVLELDGSPRVDFASQGLVRRLYLDCPKVLYSKEYAAPQEVVCLPLARVRRRPVKRWIYVKEVECAMVLARDPEDDKGYIRVGMVTNETYTMSDPSEYWAKNPNFAHGGEMATIDIH